MFPKYTVNCNMEDYLTTVTNMPVSQMENAYKYYTFFKKKFMFYSARTLN